MSATWIGAAALAGGLCALPLAGCANAQAGGQEGGSLAARVRAAPDGEVRMHFTSRPGVCGSENGISHVNRDGRHQQRVVINGGTYTHSGDQWECLEGPVHVRLLLRGGRIADLKTRVARGWSDDVGGRVTDLGRVPAPAAADYLLSLAERADDGDVGEDAVFPATIADSATTWPRLLRIARNGGVSDKVRRSSVFWLSQQAGDQVTQGLTDLVDDDDEDRELREHAVFALSQRPREESVPALIRVARTHRDGHIRKTALFWLGQSRDPRAIALFEEILSQ